jgi:hypothetical protein
MAAQEGQLVGHDRLVVRAVVDVEVVDARIDAQLPEEGATSRLDRGAGAGDLVGSADADQPRAVQSRGVDGGTVGLAEQPARRDAVAPAGVLADGDDMPPACLAPGALMNAASCGWPTAGR